MTNHHIVFVYGSLKKGSYNHTFLETATPLGPATTVRKFLLLDGGFPRLVSAGDLPFAMAKKHAMSNARVAGEMYAVDDRTLRELDRLEGTPTHYRREEVATTLDGGEAKIPAFAYIANNPEHYFRHCRVIMPNDADVVAWHGPTRR